MAVLLFCYLYEYTKLSGEWNLVTVESSQQPYFRNKHMLHYTFAFPTVDLYYKPWFFIIRSSVVRTKR